MLQGRRGRVGRLALVDTGRLAPPLHGTVLLVADDLIWASRLRAAAERAGADCAAVRSLAELSGRLADGNVAAVVVDLGGRAYDGVEAVRLAGEKAPGSAVVAVGQHDDLDLRRRALAAGALRVFSYNKMFSDGRTVFTDLLGGRFPRRAP